MSKIDEMRKDVFESLGLVSSIFMSQDKKGTEIVMPTEQLTEVGDKLMARIVAYGTEQRREEISYADDCLKEEYAEDWLQFRDDRYKELTELLEEYKNGIESNDSTGR